MLREHWAGKRAGCRLVGSRRASRLCVGDSVACRVCHGQQGLQPLPVSTGHRGQSWTDGGEVPKVPGISRAELTAAAKTCSDEREGGGRMLIGRPRRAFCFLRTLAQQTGPTRLEVIWHQAFSAVKGARSFELKLLAPFHIFIIRRGISTYKEFKRHARVKPAH